MSRPGILLVGAGGHSLACIEVIEREDRFVIEGLLGLPGELGQQRLGYPVLGDDDALESLAAPGRHALVCVGQIKSPEPRMRLFERLQKLGYALPSIVSPTATVSPHASIGKGSIVMHGAVINAGARVGANCIINSLALVEHGAAVGDHCHISTGVLINGDVSVGEGSFIGSGSQVREGIRVGRRCVVGLGTTLLKDLPDVTTWKNN